MKNINLYLKQIKTAKQDIKKLSTIQDRIAKSIHKSLGVSETSLVGECLFDYLYNAGSLKDLQRIYKKYKNIE